MILSEARDQCQTKRFPDIISAMKRLHPGHIKAQLSTAVSAVGQQRFFQDRLSLGLILPALAFNIITLVVMVIRLHPTTFSIPVHYSSLGGFDALGPWYQIYQIAIFGFAVTIVNTTLASYSFARSRIASFYLLTGGFVVALFCLIIGTAFAVVV